MHQLLYKVAFSIEDGDHLVFVGDLINKGPNSGAVVDLARESSASCVRGNNEDRILLLRRQMVESGTLKSNDTEEFSSEKELRERAVARSLSDEQVQWLEHCPVMLKIDSVPGMGQVVVAHAGIVPGVDLEKQDPSMVMSMRTMDLRTHVPSSSRKGTQWAKVCTCFLYRLNSQLTCARCSTSTSPCSIIPSRNPRMIPAPEQQQWCTATTLKSVSISVLLQRALTQGVWMVAS